MEVARKRNSSNSWMSSAGGKGSLLDPSINSKQRGGGLGLESPLATQLQQAWLQTQLPKRNLPNLEYLSPPDFLAPSSPQAFQQRQQQQPFATSATSRSSSFSQLSPSYSNTSPPPLQYSPEAFSPAYTSQSDVGSAVSTGGQEEVGEVSAEPMEDDMMLQYLSDMLMDEDLPNQKCMYQQCSAYQAMTEELADLIGDRSPTGSGVLGDMPLSDPSPRLGEAEKDLAVNSWIDEVLNSNPQDFLREEEVGESNVADEVSSIASGLTNITTGSSPDLPGVAPASVVPANRPVAELPFGVKGTEYDCPYLENVQTITIKDFTNGRSGIESLAELYPLIMQCAQAVATDNVGEAHQLINHLRLRITPFGDGGQRLSYYVVEALVARLSGTGAQLYTAMSSNRPSAVEMLKAYRMYVQCNPLPKISHFFANATIIEAVKGHDRIHIVDFGILYGVQWPCFLAKLKLRDGGPPAVRITGIDVAQPGFQKNDRVEDTGRRLAAKAKELGIEFEFHAIAGKWEQITPAQLALRDNETLIVNSMFRLRNLLDETVMASSPRKMLLTKIHSLNPKLFIMGVVSAGYNSPFFMARFREAINHFSAVFDAMHSTVPDTDLRRLAEKEILGREILNIVACEGTERIERAETYRQWQSRSLNAGFKQQPVAEGIIAKANSFLKDYNDNYGIAVDGNWLLTGWKDRVLHGLTAWVPS